MLPKITRVKCANCEHKWDLKKRVDDDFKETWICEKCGFVASAFNFIPEHQNRKKDQ